MTETLVVLTTHFGTNFSGGSTATCKIFERLQQHFGSIAVVGTALGEHRFDNLVFHQYKKHRDAARILKSFDPSRCVFYGDFFNAYIFTLCNIPFYFTYHDNWPELGNLSIRFRLQRLYYWSAYRRIFKHARHVFAVSGLKLSQVQTFTSRVSLVRNGVMQSPGTGTSSRVTDNGNNRNGNNRNGERKNVLMVGNIDQRKYRLAARLFDTLPEEPEFTVDIYGHSNDASLADKLQRHAFVNIKGFTNHIPYEHYRLLLHTSLMENLSIVWCEAVLHRTPVLAFDIGAACEVITGYRGVCISDYNIDSMRRELLQHMTEPAVPDAQPDTTELAEFASEFNWDTAARRYSEVMFEQ